MLKHSSSSIPTDINRSPKGSPRFFRQSHSTITTTKSPLPRILLAPHAIAVAIELAVPGDVPRLPARIGRPRVFHTSLQLAYEDFPPVSAAPMNPLVCWGAGEASAVKVGASSTGAGGGGKTAAGCTSASVGSTVPVLVTVGSCDCVVVVVDDEELAVVRVVDVLLVVAVKDVVGDALVVGVSSLVVSCLGASTTKPANRTTITMETIPQ